jgi:hypothetical protein
MRILRSKPVSDIFQPGFMCCRGTRRVAALPRTFQCEALRSAYQLVLRRVMCVLGESQTRENYEQDDLLLDRFGDGFQIREPGCGVLDVQLTVLARYGSSHLAVARLINFRYVPHIT